MAKTLLDLRIEKGLYLKDVAEKTGIPEDELRAVEESGIVPSDIAEILINDYYLTDTYFTVEEVGKLTPQNPTRYFLKISIVYYILSILAAGVPMLLSYAEIFVKVFNPESSFSIVGSPIFTVFNSLWGIAVTILGCILFTDYILKKTTFKGDIKKYQFLHHAIPSGVIAGFSMISACITTFGYDRTNNEVSTIYFLLMLIVLAISVIEMAFIVAVSVKLLNTAIEEDRDKKQKTLKTFAIVVTISSVLAFVLTVVSQIILNDYNILVIIRRFFVYGLYIAVAWAVALNESDNVKKSKIAYTILPLISICQSFIFTIIELIV